MTGRPIKNSKRINTNHINIMKKINLDDPIFRIIISETKQNYVSNVLNSSNTLYSGLFQQINKIKKN